MISFALSAYLFVGNLTKAEPLLLLLSFSTGMKISTILPALWNIACSSVMVICSGRLDAKTKMDSSFFLHTRWGRGGLLIWPPLPTAMAVSSCALDVDMFPRRIFFNLLYSRKTMASLYLNYYIKKNISRKEQLSDKGCHFTNHISGLKRSPWYVFHKAEINKWQLILHTCNSHFPNFEAHHR